MGAGQTALVALTANEALAAAPLVVYARGADEIDVPVDGTGTAFLAHVTPTSADVSGAVTLTVTLVDKANNKTTA
ncbi:MAG TPA: hypothetical protein VGO62_09370, partial [Myxococcota bacterium]